jgi:hypothetical protein
LKLQNQEWESKTQKLFKQLQQQQILQEKKEYEKSLKLNDLANAYSDQKKRIRDLEDQVGILNHEKSVAIA